MNSSELLVSWSLDLPVFETTLFPEKQKRQTFKCEPDFRQGNGGFFGLCHDFGQQKKHLLAEFGIMKWQHVVIYNALDIQMPPELAVFIFIGYRYDFRPS